MNKVVYKYIVDANKSPQGQLHTIKMPADAVIVRVGMQHDNHTIWAIVTANNTSIEVDRIFFYVGTGHSYPEDCSQYIGTYDDSIFVWHMFEFIA